MTCVPKTQISLGICPVWSESSLSAWRNRGSIATHWVHSEDSNQTGRMLRLIWALAGCTCHFVSFVMRWLIYCVSEQGRLWWDCCLILHCSSLWYAPISHGLAHYTPTNFVCGGVYCFHFVCPSMCPSMTLCFFPNILKMQWWIFISFCRHIDINKVYLHKKK